MEGNKPGIDVPQVINHVTVAINSVSQETVSQEEVASLMTELKSLTTAFSTVSECRNDVAKSEGLLYSSIEKIFSVITSIDIFLEALRVVRNSLAQNHTNQNLLRTMSSILAQLGLICLTGADDTWDQLPYSVITSTDLEPTTKTLLIKITLQALINAVVNNNENAEVVQEDAKKYVLPLLQAGFAEAGYLMNTLLSLLPEFHDVIDSPEKFQVLLSLTDSESALLCLEKFGNNKMFLEKMYDCMDSIQRISFLQFLSSSPCNKYSPFFIERFTQNADYLLKSTLTEIESNFEEFLLLTSIVSALSSTDDLPSLQGDAGLVTTVTHLFIMTRKNKIFDPIEKLAHTTENEQNHPAFMFKAYLTRTLGNLAFRHPNNQTLIGTSCLGMILDGTKIDALNPFITQWSILAIRNLLEDHEDNQAYVRSLRVQRAAYSEVLQEFGIQVTVDEEGNLEPRSSRQP